MSRQVAGVLASGRAIDVDTFADITVTGVEAVEMGDGQVTVVFTADVSADVAARVARRITMPPAVEAAFAALEARVAALENNTTTNVSLKGR